MANATGEMSAAEGEISSDHISLEITIKPGEGRFWLLEEKKGSDDEEPKLLYDASIIALLIVYIREINRKCFKAPNNKLSTDTTAFIIIPPKINTMIIIY